MSLARIAYPWNSKEDTPEFIIIPQHILLMSEIEGVKREIESLKETIVNQLQDDMDKRGFFFMEHNTKTIIDAMTSQTKQTMQEIVKKTEVITSKVKEVSGTNASNVMDVVID